MRFEMRLPMVTRAVGLRLTRADCWYGSFSSGVIWNVSTPKVCSTTRPTSAERAPVSARVARASTSRCSLLVRAAAGAASSMSPLGAWSLNSSVRMSSVCSGGSDWNCGCSRSVVPAMRMVMR